MQEVRLRDTKCLNEYIAAGGDPTSQDNLDIIDKFVGEHIVCSVTQTVKMLIELAAGDVYPVGDVIDDLQAKYINKTDAIEELVEEIERLEGFLNDGNDSSGTLSDVANELQIKQDRIESLQSEDGQEIEAIEWWAVDEFLADKLTDHDEIVEDLLDFTVWGSQTMEIMIPNSVIVEIMAECELLDGQDLCAD